MGVVYKAKPSHWPITSLTWELVEELQKIPEYVIFLLKIKRYLVIISMDNYRHPQ